MLRRNVKKSWFRINALLRESATLMVLLAASLDFARGQEALFAWEGEANIDSYGQDVAGAGDVDGDGHVDLLVGAMENDDGGSQAGKVYVYSGASGELLTTHVGLVTSERLSEVAGLGDLDGDGLGDYAVGAPGAAGDCGLLQGRVDCYLSSALPNVFLYGEKCDDGFGSVLAGPGDVDGDGVPDLLIGAPDYGTIGALDTGRAYLYSGATMQVVYTYQGDGQGARLGNYLGGAGDVNADGYQDFIISQNPSGGTGEASVYSGVDGSLLYQYVGERGGTLWGGVDGIGDIDGDGCSEFVLGVPSADNDKGNGLVYSGATGELRYSHTGTYLSELGKAVAGVGDVNADGVPDYALGAPRSRIGDPDRGAVYLYSGASGRLLYRFLGESRADFFGWSLAGPGDVNRDGFADILVGAVSKETPLGKDVGGAYLFAGNDLFLQASLPEVAEGATLSLFTRDGEPGATYFLSIHEINGIRAPRNLLTAGTLDEFGEAAFEIEVPAGLAGNEFAFKAWSWKTVPQDLPPDRATWSSGPTDPTTVNKRVLIDSGRERVVIE